MRLLDDTDPVPLVLARLRGDQRLTAMLAKAGGHIAGERVDPWPCLEVSAGTDTVVNSRSGLTACTVGFDLHESFDNATGPWMLRRIIKAAIASVAAMAEEHYTDPAQPIVSAVDASGSISQINTTAGQARLSASVTLYMLPAEEASEP